LNGFSDLTILFFPALKTRSRRLSEFNSPLDESAVADDSRGASLSGDIHV
jgi:hypothetical protein